MQITIVSFYAFNRPNREVFIKGENFEQIHEVLTTICPSYEPIEIIQGEMHNTPLAELNNVMQTVHRFKPNNLQREVMVEALCDFLRKANTTKEMLSVGDGSQLADMIDQKIKEAENLKIRLRVA